MLKNQSLQEKDSNQQYMQNKHLPVFKRNDNQQQLTIFDLAFLGYIPDITNHSSKEQDRDGFTVAMILALNDVNIPKQWQHKPNIQNKYGNTVAMLMAYKGINPDKQWIHKSNLQNKNGNTVAMILIKRNIIPQACWIHKASIQNSLGYTTAMIFAVNGNIPQKCWQHNYKIKNHKNQTIISLLNKQDYIFVNKQKVLNYQSEYEENICIICLYQGQKEFIKSKCKHKICKDCFQCILTNNKNYCIKCPVCNQKGQYYKNTEMILKL